MRAYGKQSNNQAHNKEEKALISRLIERDPLSGFYYRSLLVYLVISIVFLLWPFDFFHKRNGATLLGTSNGIEFPQDGQVVSLSSTESLCGRLVIGTGFTLEVWAATDDPDQAGPARIVSYSLNPLERNFTLGQSNKKLIMRLRTTETDLNGVKPHAELDSVFGSSEPQHIVVAYDFSEQRIFVNGEMMLRQKIPGGRFTNWDPSYPLLLGNEATGNRPWNGKIFYVAIYDRALSEREIHKNYLAGLAWDELPSKLDPLTSDGLVVRYLFEERKGDKVGDDSNTDTSLDLYIPKYIQYAEKAYLYSNLEESLKNPKFFKDAALNILAFIPLGLLFHATLRSRYGSSLKTFAFVFIAGTLFTFGIESLQYLLVTRQSSFIDVFNNILGTTIGISIDRFYEIYLHSQS
jgi:VanZ family protein